MENIETKIAKALLELAVKHKDNKTIAKALTKFLIQIGLTNKTLAILKKAQEIKNKELKVEIKIAKNFKEINLENLTKILKEIFPDREIKLKISKKEDLLRGMVIIIEDYQLDLSSKSILNQIKETFYERV